MTSNDDEWTTSNKTLLSDLEEQEREPEPSFEPPGINVASKYFFSSYNLKKSKKLKQVDITDGMKEYKKIKLKKKKSLHHKVARNLTCLNQIQPNSCFSMFSKKKKESEVATALSVRPVDMSVKVERPPLQILNHQPSI